MRFGVASLEPAGEPDIRWARSPLADDGEEGPEMLDLLDLIPGLLSPLTLNTLALPPITASCSPGGSARTPFPTPVTPAAPPRSTLALLLLPPVSTLPLLLVPPLPPGFFSAVSSMLMPFPEKMSSKSCWLF